MPGYKRDENGKPLCRWCSGALPKGRRSWCSDKCVNEALIVHSPPHTRKAVFERDKGICLHCGEDTVKLEKTLLRLRGMMSGGILSYDRTENKASRRYGIDRERLAEICHEANMLKSRAENLARRRLKFPAFQLPAPPEPLVLTAAEARIVRVHLRFRSLCAARRAGILADLSARGFTEIESRSLWEADHIVPVVLGGGLCGLENYRTLCMPCHKIETKALAAHRAEERRKARAAEMKDSNETEFNF